MVKRLIKMSAVVIFIFCYSLGLQSQAWEKLSRKDRPTFRDIQQEVYRFYDRVKETAGRKPGFKQFKRWEWFAESRLNKEGYFDPSLNWNGWLEKEDRFGPGETAGGAWGPLGPAVMPGILGLGRINCIEFDPRSPDIIWVGAPTGGLWKTTDGGLSWTTNTDHLPNLGVSDILIHPDNPNIMYIATGDKQRGSTLSVGVMKSWDAGQTWQFTGLNPGVSEKCKIGKMLLHPHNPEILLAAANKGIYKTIDGGSTWQNKCSGDFFDIEIHPLNPAIWYASRSAYGVYRSTDAGETWNRLTTGLPNPGPDIGRIAIAVSKASPEVLYALYSEDVVSEGWLWGLYGVYRSRNTGNTWTLQASSPNLLGWSETGNDTGGQAGYALVFEVNPANPDELYVGSVNLWKSLDAGVTWKTFGTSIHVDHHDFAFFPGSSVTIFSCNDGGVFKSTDDGMTWVDLTSGLGIHQVYRLGISPQAPNMVVIGAQDNGSSLLKDEWYGINGGDGTDCQIDPCDNSIIYCSWQWGHFLRSTDGGNIFYNIFARDGAAWIAPLEIDPNDSAVLYTAATQVFRTFDRGDNWSAAGSVLSNEPLRVLAVAPSASQYLYTTDGSRLFKSTNSGASWTEMQNDQFPTFITDIAVHPQNPEILWITFGGYGRWNSRFIWFNIPYEIDKPKVFHSVDGGNSWSDVSGLLPNIPANCLAIDPFSLGVYAGTDLGVFYSASGLGDWQRYDNGLPNVIVTDMEIQTVTGKIIVSTYGRGVWESPLATSVNGSMVYPPLDFSARTEINKSLFRTEYINVFKWATNPLNLQNIKYYRIYQVSGTSHTLLAELTADTFTYLRRNVERGTYQYQLAAVDSEGHESPPLKVTLRIE